MKTFLRAFKGHLTFLLSKGRGKYLQWTVHSLYDAKNVFDHQRPCSTSIFKIGLIQVKKKYCVRRNFFGKKSFAQFFFHFFSTIQMGTLSDLPRFFCCHHLSSTRSNSIFSLVLNLGGTGCAGRVLRLGRRRLSLY